MMQGRQEGQHQQVAIAKQLQYQSAKILSLTQTEYALYVQEVVQQNPFLQCSLDSPGYGESSTVIHMDELAASEPSLQDVLLAQWLLEPLAQEERLCAAGRVVISNLNEHGFHHLPLTQLATKEYSLILLRKVSQAIALLEPIGCATEGIWHSIWTQSQQNPLHLDWCKISCDYFIWVIKEWQASDDGQQAARRLAAKDEEELLTYLRQFQPYPAAGYHSTFTASYEKTDLRVILTSDGVWQVEQNSSIGIERLTQIEYQHMLARLREQDKETKAWLRRKWQQANDIWSMHHYRTARLLQVVQYIVQWQSTFLHQPRQGLRALQLADIAQALEITVSTVSRVIKNKWIDTPHGRMQVQALLSRRQMHEQVIYSRQAIKERMRLIIYQAGAKGLSDAKISRLLALEGIYVARRTINKYRHEEGI